MNITVANLVKGGVGKSTTAVNLAAQLLSDGESVQLVDLDDEQRAAFEWSEAAGVPASLNPDSLTLSNLMKSEYDFTIFDTGGYDLVSTQALISFSDVVLIPTSMSKIETKALIKLAHKITAIKEIVPNGTYNLIIVPSRINPSVSSTKIAEYFAPLKELGYKIAPAIRYRAAYDVTFEDGGSVVGGSDIKARTEIYNLSSYIRGVCDA